MKNWFLIVFFFCCVTILHSQTECNNLIEEATDLYNSGNYNECIRKLEKGLKECPLSKGKKEKAYILLVNSNIEKDSIPAVEKNFKQLLLNNPAFKLKDYDGIDDFKTSFRNYYVYPKFSVGLQFNYAQPFVLGFGNYQIAANVEQVKKITCDPYLNVNLSAEFRLFERIALFGNLGTYTINSTSEVKNSSWSLSTKEKLNYFQWDVGTKFYFNTKHKLNFYLTTGLSNLNLISGKLNLIQKKSNIETPYLNAGTGIDYKEGNFATHKTIRSRYVSALLLGTGLVYKQGRWGYGVDFRSSITMNTINKRKDRLADLTLIQEYSYIDSDLIMARLEGAITISYLFYKVKSKK